MGIALIMARQLAGHEEYQSGWSYPIASCKTPLRLGRILASGTDSQMDLLDRTFRMNQATLGIRGLGKRGIPIAIPAGATITVTNCDEGLFCRCSWRNLIVRVMKSDIETQGTLVESIEP